MKRLNLSLLVALGMVGNAWAQSSAVYKNIGTLTTRTNIDAKVVINNGLIFFDLLNPTIEDSAPLFSESAVSGLIFQTKDTLFYTNTGTMVAEPGFSFNYTSGKGIGPATAFNNSGTILTLDGPDVGLVGLGTAATSVPFPTQTIGAGTNGTVPSGLIVYANTINVSGLMKTGNQGVMQLTGTTLLLNNAGLSAGTISEIDTNNTVSTSVDGSTGVNGVAIFAPPADVYDIYWAGTNGASSTGDVAAIEDGFDPSVTAIPEVEVEFPTNLQSRNGFMDGYQIVNHQYAVVDTTLIPPDQIFPISTLVPGFGLTPTVTSPPVAPNFTGYASLDFLPLTANALQTNVSVSIVLVNSAFADSNITVSPPQFLEFESSTGIISFEQLIKFSAPTLNVLTGGIETNSIYFVDDGGPDIVLGTPYALLTNTTYVTDSKPNAFDISLTVPLDYTLGLPGNIPAVDAFSDIAPAGIFGSNTVPMDTAFYCAQVGRNPEVLNGLFDYTSTLLSGNDAGLPEMTNEGGRIEINAKSLDVSNMRLYANGVVNLKSQKLIGLPQATDFGNMNVDLGSNNAPLVVKNLFPSNFSRLRGDIAAYTVDWVNQQTNNGVGPGQANRVTNFWHYHILVLDQDLRDNFKTTGLNVALRGTSVEVDDSLTIIQSALFQASNLTINAAVHLSGAAGTLQATTVPGLKALQVGATGSITADTYIDIGVPLSASSVAPTKQNTPLLCFTNLGTITSQQIELQAQIIANGGTVTAGNNGSIIFNALTNYLGAGLGYTNSMVADGDIELTGTSIQVTNSSILAGRNGSGQLVLTPSSELADHLPNAASTNAYVTNHWQVASGFSLAATPVNGDLFGTQITSVAARPNQRILHTWAAHDFGPSVAGFFNNAVIGHLILDRTTNSAGSTFVFSPVGNKKSAMYVDYLEFDENLPGQDYHSGLEIDPGFTIYFANANIDPTKLHQVYTNLVWVPQFAGPNSTTNILYSGGSNCQMNIALATSASIDTDGSGNPNSSGGDILDNPTYGPVPCPSLVTSVEDLLVTNGLPVQQFIVWTTGQGVVTPVLPAKGLGVGQKVTLTATPAPGWLFLDWSGAVVSSSPTVTVTVPANQAFAFVTANFITNAFIGLAGTYNGLFSVPGAVSNGSSGAVTFTLNNQGVFSGKLTMGASNYPFSSRFNIANEANFSATNGHNVLAVSLEAGASAQTDLVTGTVSNSVFSATLVAYQTPVYTAAKPSPQAGTYNLVLLGNIDSSVSPGGDSYGTVTVSKLGQLTAVGSLADGTTFSQSVPVSREGNWPLYFVPAGVAQPLLGYIAFDTNGTSGASSGFAGLVTWIKTPGKGTFYTNGFTNTAALTGSLFNPGIQRTNGLQLNGPTVTLTGGNLPATVVETVTLTSPEVYQSADKSLTLTINAATGSFSGSYLAPGSRTKVALNGVVLQNTGTADGLFYGSSQSGSVLLQGH